jgi:hypothetical protein
MRVERASTPRFMAGSRDLCDERQVLKKSSVFVLASTARTL